VTSPPAFLPPADIPRRMSYAMNMGDFVFGMGAFLTPLLVALLMRTLRLERTFLVLSSFAVVPLALGLGVQLEQLVSPGTESVAGGLGILLSDPFVWLCCLALFCHVPIEASVATRATTLMTDKGVGESAASTLLSVFWLTFMGSRLITALTLPEGADTLLVLVMALFCVAFTLGIATSRSAWMTCTMVVVAGLVLGPIFPTLIAILLGHVQPSFDEVPESLEDLRWRGVVPTCHTSPDKPHGVPAHAVGTRLHRFVALKFLPEEMAHDLDFVCASPAEPFTVSVPQTIV